MNQKSGIKIFRGVYSRENVPAEIAKKECGSINLETEIGKGTHWVCYRNTENICEYFDLFGLTMPQEVRKHLNTAGKQLICLSDKIQERNSVLRGCCVYII